MTTFLPASLLRAGQTLARSRAGKSAVLKLRRFSVSATHLLREMVWTRYALNLPVNRCVDPMASDLHSSVRTIQVGATHPFRRALPRLREGHPAASYFKAKSHESPYREYVTILKGGSLWGYAHGAVFTDQREFIPAFASDPWGARLHEVWTRSYLPKIQQIRGRVLYLVTPEATRNFHHWMIDLLPRIGIVQRAGISLASFDAIVVNHANLSFQRETLAHFGIRPEQLINISPSLRIQADELVVPSLKPTNEELPAEHVQFLRREFLPEGNARARTRRLYLSRRGALTRRLLNEDEVFHFLQTFGFESVELSSLTIAQQAELFAEAEFLVGPSGAAFANLVFASPGAHVIEFSAPSWLTVYHWMISARRGLRHQVVASAESAPPPVLNINGRGSDFTVDLDDVARAIGPLLAADLSTKKADKVSTKVRRSGLLTNPDAFPLAT